MNSTPTRPIPPAGYDLLDGFEAVRHLRAVGFDPAKAHFRAIRYDGSRAIDFPPARTSRCPALEQAQRQRHNVYVSVGSAREDALVESIPAAAAEWDDLLREDVEALLHEAIVRGLPEPTLTLTTWALGSPHVWFRFRQPCTDPPRYRALMDRLVVALGSDPTCVNPSQLMRLAGSSYIQKAGKPRAGQVIGQARIIHLDEDATTSIEELEAWVAGEFTRRGLTVGSSGKRYGPGDAKPPRDEDRALPPRSMAQIEAALAALPRRVTGLNNEHSHPYHSLALAGLRDALYRLATGTEEQRIAAAFEQAVALMEAHSPSRECAWNVAQHLAGRKVWIDEAAFWGRARACGWDPAADKAVKRLALVGVGS